MRFSTDLKSISLSVVYGSISSGLRILTGRNKFRLTVIIKIPILGPGDGAEERQRRSQWGIEISLNSGEMRASWSYLVLWDYSVMEWMIVPFANLKKWPCSIGIRSSGAK